MASSRTASIKSRSRSRPPERRKAAKYCAGRRTSGSNKPANLSCPPEKPRLPLANINPSSTWAGPPSGGVGGTPNLLPSPTFGQNTPRDENAWAGKLETLIRLFPQCFKAVFGGGHGEHIVPEEALDLAGGPRPVLERQVGRRSPRREVLPNRLEIGPLVPSLAIEIGLPAQALIGDRVELARQIEDRNTPHARAHAAPRHLAVERRALVEGPALDHVLGGVEAVGLVEDALHQRRHRQHAPRRLAVGGAQLEIPLQSKLGKQGREGESATVEQGG